MSTYPGFDVIDIPSRAKKLTISKAIATRKPAKVEPFPEDWPTDSDAFDPWIEAGLMTRKANT